VSVILFIVILGALVFVHELGHFIAAKKSGMKVSEFALGFPPKLFSKKIGETLYALNMIPFGGYVKIVGENPGEDGDADEPRSFQNKNRFLQAIVLSAGVLGNLIFAWLLLTVGFMNGMPVADEKYSDEFISEKRVLITNVLPESPAFISGLMPGDEVLKIVHGGISAITPSADQISEIIGSANNKEIELEIKRIDEIKTFLVRPSLNIVPEKSAIGIEMTSIGTAKFGIVKATAEGFKHTVSLTRDVATGLASFFKDAFMFRADFASVVGPVGIAGFVGDASHMGLGYLLSFVAMISVNLAVLNIAPLPALDGGRLIFVILEAILRRKISPKFQNYVNGIGFAVLLGLMVIVTYRDILRLF
jgi:regulator of sigma E protease